jgi:hypothetical protein
VAGREESSFFEKKEAKKLYSVGSPSVRMAGEAQKHTAKRTIAASKAAPNEQSFFASFCSQKEDASFPLPSPLKA